MPSGRTASVVFLGNDAALNATLARIEGKLKALSDTADAQNAKIAASSEAAGVKMGRAYEEGTAKAGASLKALSRLGGDLGVPLSGSLNEVGKKLDETSVKGQKLHDTLAALGKVTLVAGLGGFAAAAYEGVKGAMALQRAMEQLHTQAGASQAEVNKMTKAVMNMAGPLATSPTALADSLYHVESAGFRGAKALDIMTAAAKESKISGADLTDTTTALTASVFSGIKGAQDYAKAMGMLNATVGAGDMKFQDLNEALGGPMLATVKGYGLSLHDVSAALATMGDLNIRGADAATQLRMAVQYMAKPAATAGPLLKELGLNTHSFANAMANGGLMPALKLLHDRLDAVGVKGNQMAQVIGDLFTKKGASGIDILENSLGKLGQKYTQTGATANQQNEAWKATTHTLAFQMDQLKATVQALADKFGTYLIPKLEAAGQAVKDVIGWLGKHKAAAEALAIVIGSVLGTAITVFAYTKAVAFVGATRDMIAGMSRVVSFATGGLIPALGKTEAANATAGASFTAVGTEAGVAAGEVEARTAAMAGAVEADDAAIVSANEAAGASFTALLGPIGLAAAAIAGYNALAGNPQQAGANAVAGLQKASGRALTHGQLQGLLASTGAIGSTGKHGLYPWSSDNTALIQSADKALKQFAGSGNQALLDGIISRAEKLKKTWPQDAAALNTLIGVMNKAKSEGAAGVAAAGGSLPGNVMSLLNPATPTGGPVPVPSRGSNAQRIAGALKAQGFSNVAIAGILGNFGQENGGNTLSGISTSAGPGGIGIAQWIGSRATAEQGYAAAHHESSTSLAAQVGFLVQELRTTYHGTFNAIQHASSAAQAAQLFEQGYEGAGTPVMAHRIALANQAMQMLGGGGGGLSNAGLNALLDAGKKKGPKSIRELLYANPFAGDSGVTQGRTDMGVDFTAPAGSRIGAIGSGVIDKIITNWFKGQPLIEERLTSGPDKGKFVYYAEQIARNMRTGMPLGVHQGEQVKAGQTIGTVASSGTGLELGFGAGGGRTLAQATTGYREGEITPAGQAFNRFLQSIGSGRYETVKGGVVTGGGSSIMATLAQLQQAFEQAITKAGTSLIQKLSNAIQSGTVKTLGNLLGVSTTTPITTSGVTRTVYGRPVLNPWGSTTQSLGIRLHSAFEGLSPTASLAQINRAGVGLVAKGVAGSTQDRSYQQELLNLEQIGKTKEAQQLVAAHKAAMQALTQELYAAQVTKDAESLQLETQQLTDQTTAITNAAQDQLNVVKAQYQLTNDIGQAQITAIRDMTQTVTDQFSGMVQSVEDHTQAMSDAANAVVQGINDQTQIQVDILGERGLYGLNLVAQKLQVQLDQQKASDDRAIAVAQQNLDQVTASEHQLVSNAQINLDQVTAAQNQAAAIAQQRADTVAVHQAIRLASAQARVDANTLHEDVSTVGPAQIAVDLGATLPKAQQDVLNAQLKRAQGAAGVSEGNMAKWFSGVQDSVNQITSAAQQQATSAQTAADTQIAAAQGTLAAVQGEAALVIAAAQGTLTGVSGTAATTEAGLQSGVSVATATAATQFAGSGMVMNFYGVDLSDPTQLGEAASWAIRTTTAQT